MRGGARRLIQRLAVADAKVRWVVAENMHLTLKFLGDVASEDIAEVCRAVAESVRDIEPFEFRCHGAGAFPDLARPRTVWIGVDEGSEAVLALHQAVELALGELGFMPERRRFRPHLTIGRVRGQGPSTDQLGQLIGQHVDFDTGRTQVDELVVFSSAPGPDGPIYTALSHAQLGGRS